MTRLNQFVMFGEHENYLFQNENNVVLNENSVERKPCINRESKSLELTIQLYSWYGEHEAPSICNTTVYISNCNIPLSTTHCCSNLSIKITKSITLVIILDLIHLAACSDLPFFSS